jgi:S-adenosylmethionine/arginine decarboxylase-like enzyme
MNYWGYHLIINLGECDLDSIADSDNHRAFLKELVERIDMKAYGEPIVEHFATHDADKAGFSIVQLIETSNICGHFVDKDGSGFLDIFSCKPFDPKEAIAVIQKYYSPRFVSDQMILRRAP